MTQFVRGLLAVFVLIGLLIAPVAAQTASETAPQVTIDKKKLLVQPRNADGTLEMVSFWEDPVLWARLQQQTFYGYLKGALSRIKAGAPLAAASTLMLLSFGYGVFHAAGPGHGKAVISAWLLATENELRRGVVISFLSALIQALSAILIVSVLLLIVASVGAAARNVEGFFESASWAMVGAMGLYLLWTAFRSPAHRHGHDHKHHHEHHHDETCGHGHLPEAKQLKGDWSLATAFSLAFAVGIRPCTGAIAVLIAANSLGLYWAGIASTFAMAAGTFLTVSVIAAIAVYSKTLALKMAAKDDRWLDWTVFGLRLSGGAAIAGLGVILFLGSLG
ncbi:MAG: nickel/cobalt transporter [Rhizobiales bacterium]|nr:nickel/cobalt transporter [Hyphomicrobiales bacterium]